MAGPRPDDPYNPVQSVAPTTAAPNDYLDVRANPNQFGAQVGQAVQKLGATGQQAANETLQTLTQYQGMLNETWIANASSIQNQKIGDVDGWYKSLEGPAAAAAYPEAQKKVQQIRQDILASAPNAAAARGFNMIAARAEGFTLRDYGNYMGTQIKQGRTKANIAQLETIQATAASPSVYSDPTQWGSLVGSTKDLAAKITADQGWGPDPVTGENPTGMAIDTKGNVTFNGSSAGQQAQSVYTNYINQQLGKVWDARLMDEASKNPLAAQKTLDDNSNQIPPETKAKWTHTLRSAVNAADTATFAEGVLSQSEASYYQNLIPSTGPITAAPQWLHNATQTQESQNNPNAVGPNIPGKGSAQGSMQVMPNTLTNPGYGVTPAKDNSPAELKRVGDDYLDAMYKKYHGNTMQALVAYNWGPAHADQWIKQGGDFTQLPPETQVYLSKILPKGMGAQGGSLSQVDWYRKNEPQILNDTYNQAMAKYGDITLANQAVSHVEQKINLVKQQAEDQIKVQRDNILSLVKGDGQHPPIMSMSQLEGPGADPKLAAEWMDYKSKDWFGSTAIESLVSSRNKGLAKTYGTDFYTQLQNTLTGKTKSPNDLGPYMKLSGGTPEDAAVTNTGYWYLKNQIDQLHDPKNGAANTAFAQAESQALKVLHDQATGANIQPGLHSPELENAFNKNLIDITNRIEAQRAAGKTADQLFHPDSPDYIGKYVILPKPAAVMKAFRDQAIKASTVQTVNKGLSEYKSLTDLVGAVKAGKVDRKSAEQFALSQNWVSPNPPPVPFPAP